MMKSITLWDPWASLIVLNQKKIETRSWHADYRGELAIHAAKKEASRYIVFEEPAFSALRSRHITSEKGTGVEFSPGCILGLANLTDCLYIGDNGLYEYKKVIIGGKVRGSIGKKVMGLPMGNELAFGDYTEGRFAWMMSNVHELINPIPAKGYQRIWNWDETPHLVTIDPWVIGNTKIWTPKGVVKGKKLDKYDGDAVQGLEIKGDIKNGR